MAKARMLHKKISTSQDVSKLSLPAKILFTWMIAHTDDEGRMKGDPSFIGFTVVPCMKWSDKKIFSYLNEMKDLKLIHYWQSESDWYIEFPKWGDYQQIRKDRFEPSKLPSFNHQYDNRPTTNRQPNDNQNAPQCNENELKIELNKSEDKVAPTGANTIQVMFDPRSFTPRSDVEQAAKMAWTKLEPSNPSAFFTTYLPAARRGLPAMLFGQYVSEIQQSNCNNPGAVFNSKVKSYFDSK